MDGAEFFRAEQIAEEGGHTGEAAAVAGNDDEDNQLEDEGTACFCKCVEGKDLDQEEDYINCTAPEIVGNSRPENASQTVDQTDVIFTTSCAIGEATAKSPIPQVILVKKIHHSA